MRIIARYLVASMIFMLNGCAYYSYGTKSVYGLTNVETTEYVGHQQKTGYNSPIFSPIITLDNWVQVKFSISGPYYSPIKENKSEFFNNLRMDVFITSLREGIRLDTQHMVMDQYRIGKQSKVNFLELKRYPSKAKSSYGIDVCMFSSEDIQGNSSDFFYDFHKGESIAIPYRQVDFNLLPINLLSIDPNILCGDLVVMNTNLAGEQGFFTLTLPFIEEGETTEYTIYFYPVEYRVTIK